MFVSIQLLCFLNEALEYHTNKTEMEMESFFVCVIGELDIGETWKGSHLAINGWEGELKLMHLLKSLNKNLSFI